MADGDRASAELSREQRIAAEVVRRYNLTPPIDVDGVVKQFADFEFASIPGSCDGLVLGLHGRGRPRVLLNTGQARVRTRFTLAHELGHVLLPWHIGDGFLCDTSRLLDEFEDRPSPEPEANRFAAELLLPTAWLLDRIAAHGARDLPAIMSDAEAAEVSAHVACIRLAELLPSGYVFAVVRQGVVALAGQTANTSVPPPATGFLQRTRLDRWASDVHDVTYGPTRVLWWVFRGERTKPEHEEDNRESREILDALLRRHAGSPEASRDVRKSLAGVIGYANGMARHEGDATAGALYARFRSRFATERRIPSELLVDADFDAWLHKRAEELGDG